MNPYAVQNCIVYYNVAAEGGANFYVHGFGTVEYTCTTPDPGGVGNITADPQFVDASTSNFHLLATSPCVDAGSNQPWMAGATDLDGIIRVHHRSVDMGCYEFVHGSPDADADSLDDVWELAHFLGLTNVSFHTDWDLDGSSEGNEFHAGTSPTDPLSYLGISSLSMDVASGQPVIRWSSVSNKLYSLYASSNLVHGLDTLLDEHIPATPPENVYTDTVETVEGRYYGLEVEQ